MKGLWNVEWSQQPRLSPWAGPPQRPTHSFHSSGWGWNIKPPAWDRRSLLTGSSREGPSRRDIISGNHTLHGHRGAMRSSRTRSRWTLSRTPRSRAIRVKAYRRSLGHVCTIGSSLGGAGCVRENQSGQWDVSRDALCLAPSKSAPPPRSGASIPRASAPVSTGCLLLYCGPPGCKLLEETTTSLGITGGFGMPVCKVDVTANPLVIYVGDPKCCLSGRAHGGPWDLLGNSLEQEIQPTSPDGWCAMRDDGPSTDPDLSIPLGLLPSLWERHLS